MTYALNYTLELGIYMLELFYIRDDVVMDLNRQKYVSNASVFFYKLNYAAVESKCLTEFLCCFLKRHMQKVRHTLQKNYLKKLSKKS